jgi:hypothetical protein
VVKDEAEAVEEGRAAAVAEVAVGPSRAAARVAIARVPTVGTGSGTRWDSAVVTSAARSVAPRWFGSRIRPSTGLG